MFNFLCKTFIKNYEDVNNKVVRERYGSVFSIFSIICNVILVIIKILISLITNSVSILADALNNLSDVGSNVATLFGFKLANKHADAEHPYGHGRMEYVSGMIVSFLILLMGFEAIKESVSKIFKPEELSFSSSAIVVLVISISIKLLMSIINNKAGNAIKSETLLAAGQDSRNDAIVTTSTLIGLIIFKLFNLNLDAYIGTVVSIFVIKSGIEIFSNVLNTILGKAPDKQLLLDIENTVKEHNYIHGIHDVMMHDYGPSEQFISFHVEVDAHEDVIKLHDEIDNIEKEILDKYNILTTIHMDPVDYKDETVSYLRDEVKRIVKDINQEYSIHDFRVVKGPTHTNLVFDCLLKASDTTPHNVISKRIQEEVDKLDNGPYYCVIQVENSYID